MPKEGMIFCEDKSKRLDYTSEGNFVNVKVFDCTSSRKHEKMTAYSYKQTSKCIFNKLQFENFLFTNLWVQKPVNITFEP